MDLFVAVHEDVELAIGLGVALYVDEREAVAEADRVAVLWSGEDLDASTRRELVEESALTEQERAGGMVYRRVYNLDGGRVSVLRCPAP